MKIQIIFLITLVCFLTGCVGGSRFRQSGIELRQGFYYPTINYSSGLWDSGESFVSTNTEINHRPYDRFPIAYQNSESEEKILYEPTGEFTTYKSDFVNSEFPPAWFVNLVFFQYEQINVENIPPTLNSENSYKVLFERNTENGKLKNFALEPNQTRLSGFQKRFPKYNKIIESANKPSLSADVDLNSLGLIGIGQKIFVPIGKEHRLLEIGAKASFGITWGSSILNLCDPYFIYGEKIKVESFYSNIKYYRKGICENKIKISEEYLSRIDAVSSAQLGIYSYVGESWGFDILHLDLQIFGSNLASYLDSIPLIDYKSNELYFSVENYYLNLLSIIYKG
jgi:hypothetical protein